jgi:hypothetical protein
MSEKNLSLSAQPAEGKQTLTLAKMWDSVEAVLGALADEGADQAKLAQIYDAALAIAQSADNAKRKVRALKAALASEVEARTAVVDELEELKGALESDFWSHPLLEEFVERVQEAEKEGFWEFRDQIEMEIRGELKRDMEDERADYFSQVYDEAEEEVRERVEDSLRSELAYLAEQHLGLESDDLDLRGLMAFMKGYTSKTASAERKAAMAALLKEFGAKGGGNA